MVFNHICAGRKNHYELFTNLYFLQNKNIKIVLVCILLLAYHVLRYDIKFLYYMSTKTSEDNS